MTEITITGRELKACIADVLPVMKNSRKQLMETIAKVLVVSDGWAVKFQATDRFIVIESTLNGSRNAEDELPKFRYVVDIPSLEALKTIGMSDTVTITSDGFKSERVTVPGEEADGWPGVHKFMDETWDDPDYFTWEDDGTFVSDAFRPELVKHVKDCLIVPRRNGVGKPSRFYAKDRVRGVIMPTREQG